MFLDTHKITLNKSFWVLSMQCAFVTMQAIFFQEFLAWNFCLAKTWTIFFNKVVKIGETDTKHTLIKNFLTGRIQVNTLPVEYHKAAS